jgi:hypothetical protein
MLWKRHHADELVVGRVLDQQAGAGRAGLAGILDRGIDHEQQRLIEFGVGEHHLGRLAAELQGHRAGVRGRGLLHETADLARAGERDVVDARVSGERGPGLLAVAGDDVQSTRRQARRHREPADLERAERGILAGLEHAGIAHGERGADAAPEDLHRVVPGDDVAADAVRLTQGQHGVAGVIGNRLAVHLVGGAAVELEVAGERQGVGPGLAQRLADVARLEGGELLGPIRDQLSEPGQDAAALERRHAAPVAFERASRGLNGLVHLLGAAAGDLREALAVAGIDHGERAADRLAPAPVDQHLPLADSHGRVLAAARVPRQP